MSLACREWHAWLNTMPPKPDDLHVVGDVIVNNPGVQPVLSMRDPEGINPRILTLDLHLIQRAGMWPQVMTCAEVRFDRVMRPDSLNYESVVIYSGGEKIAVIDAISIVT